ncbi:hypothetical protein GJ744_005853 [Endocarpon pusillum]|uniref:Uncharacterized protein n=1 Tax=Endocarpon pusillum TaxID=364733 RepID=A0A8H7A884_9EURO|nr:hypothetical protein GJ744_005853 [Endocarpon pusillum]
MLLFNSFLANEEIASQRYPVVEAAFVKAAAIQFTRGSIETYTELVEQFLFALDRHIGRVTAKFRVQGPELASAICATLFDFGNVDSYLWKAFSSYEAQLQAALENQKVSTGQTTISADQEANWKEEQRRAYFRSVNDPTGNRKAVYSTRDSMTRDATFSGAQDAVAHASHL